MATESFHKTFVVSDQKLADELRKKLNKPTIKINRPSKEFEEALERGRKILELL